MHTNRSIGSLASPLLRGPLFDPEAGSGTDSGSVDQDVVAKLVDNAGSGAGNTVKRPADMSNAEFEKLKSLASDLFDDDPDIGSAALKKMASMVGKGDWLQRTVEARQAPVEEEEVEVGNEPASDPSTDLALDFYTNYLDLGVEKIMGGSEMGQLLDVAKRTQGDKFDKDRWVDGMRKRIEQRVVDAFVRLNNSGQKIQTRTLDKVLSTSKDDIIGLIRSTIGDPTGIGRHASAQTPLPGSDIPEERTILPSDQEARRNPTEALAKAKDANRAAFAKRIAALQAGAGSSQA